MKPIINQEIKDYLSTLSEYQKPILEAVRQAVLSADANVKEGIKWGSITFFHKKNICGFRVAKKHITLLFMEGSSLNDHQKILEGSGSKARTIKIAKLEDVPSDAIRALVKQAISLGM